MCCCSPRWCSAAIALPMLAHVSAEGDAAWERAMLESNGTRGNFYAGRSFRCPG